eukprot:3272196-Amphidinium_carterae.1
MVAMVLGRVFNHIAYDLEFQCECHPNGNQYSYKIDVIVSLNQFRTDAKLAPRSGSLCSSNGTASTARSHGEYAGAMFLDLDKAYERVDLGILLRQVQRVGREFSGRFVQLLE